VQRLDRKRRRQQNENFENNCAAILLLTRLGLGGVVIFHW
jgi:hypothetical protein